MTSIHIKRMESALMKLISKVVNYKMRNKNLQFITITDLKLSSDLSYLKIYYTHLEDDKKEIVQKSLEKSSGFIKHEIAEAHMMRKIPELIFKYDELEENARNLESIFAKIRAEKKDIE